MLYICPCHPGAELPPLRLISSMITRCSGQAQTASRDFLNASGSWYMVRCLGRLLVQASVTLASMAKDVLRACVPTAPPCAASLATAPDLEGAMSEDRFPPPEAELRHGLVGQFAAQQVQQQRGDQRPLHHQAG